MSSKYISEEELIATIRKKGGTSNVAAIIYVVTFIAIMVMYVTYIYPMYA